MKVIRALALRTSLKEIGKELLIPMKPGDQYVLRELHDVSIEKVIITANSTFLKY